MPVVDDKSRAERNTSSPETKSAPVESLPAITTDKKEFLLTNGERIYGRVLSENDEAVYLEHPRSAS